MFKRVDEAERDESRSKTAAVAKLLPDEWPDVVRIGLQAAVAATAAFLAMRAIGSEETFLAVISAVLVLQTNRDETYQSGRSRIAGTIVGSIIGVTALAIDPGASTPILLALVMFIMGGLTVWRPQWRYGVVAAAALAVGSQSGFWDAAQQRGLAIFIGAAIGILTGLVVWPRSAEQLVRTNLRRALSACRELLDETIAAAANECDPSLSDLHHKFVRHLARAREKSQSMRLAKRTTRSALQDVVHRVERLWHSLIILDRVSENQERKGGLRRETRDEIDRFDGLACDALAHLEQLREVPREILSSLRSTCEGMEKVVRSADGEPTSIDEAALVYGLSQVRRNICEINEALPELARV